MSTTPASVEPGQPVPPGPPVVDVRIETPRGSFVKARPGGGRDFVSPFPCPFNYGSVPGTRAPDGEEVDALVLGPRLAAGARCRRTVLGVVAFVDAGRRDDKLVCGRGDELESARTRAAIRAFFTLYALCKRVGALLRRAPRPTRFEGLRVHASEPAGGAEGGVGPLSRHRVT